MKIEEILGGTAPIAGFRFLVAVAQYNSLVTDRLLEGAIDTFREPASGVASVSVVRVPGALELPFAVRRAIDSGAFDGVLALGCVIRGETGHYEAVVSGVTAGLGQINAQGIRPVVFGILTTDTLMQALDRVGGKAGHKGIEGASALLAMARLAPVLSKPGSGVSS